MRCSACGQLGHMKTNKKCPNYKNNPVNVAPTDQELAEHESSLSQDDLVKVEGTKVGQRQTQPKLEAEKFLVVRLF